MSLSLLSIVVASVLSLFLIILEISDRALQSLVSVFAIVLIIALGRKFLDAQKTPLAVWIKPAVLGAVAFTLQMLTVSTGGLYSPLLVLIHIFALGTSFLVNLTTALVFLTLSVGVLIANVILKPSLLEIFRSDPFSAALYLLSFVIIIPLSQLLAKSYFIKDAVSKVLNEYIALEELKSASILTGLNDLVIILDTKFRISSLNYAAEKGLKMTQAEAEGQPLLDLIPLKDAEGKSLTVEGLSLNQALEDGANRIVENLNLILGGEDAQSKLVRVNIRPITDPGGKVKQIVLIINPYSKDSTSFQRHLNLAPAQTEYHLKLDNFHRNLSKFKEPQLKLEIELLTHIQEDLLLSYEIEDHPRTPNFSLENILYLSENLVVQKQSLAQTLGIPLTIVRPNFHTLQPGANSLLTLKVDQVGLTTVLAKLIELCLLLCSGKTGSSVQVTAGLDSPAKIEVISQYQLPDNTQPQQLLSMYYPGGLKEKTNLRFGSGLEGFIAATLSSQLGMELKVETLPSLKFSLIPKKKR